MQKTTQSQRQAISEHVSDDESVELARTGPESVFVVTDRRVLSLTDSHEDGHDVRRIESTTLTDDVRGVSIRAVEGNDPDMIQLMLGALVALLGVAFFSFGFSNEANSFGTGVLLVGLVAVFGAVYLVYDALQTPGGEIRVDIEFEEKTDTYWLAEDESDVAAAISEVVGENYRPATQVVSASSPDAASPSS